MKKGYKYELHAHILPTAAWRVHALRSECAGLLPRLLFHTSILLFFFSCWKGILFFLQVKKKAYTVLEGICTDVRMNLLGGIQDICLADAEGNEHRFVIGKGHKIRTGFSYRFYFRDSDGISPGRNPLLKKALLTDNLLGMEEPADGPSAPI